MKVVKFYNPMEIKLKEYDKVTCPHCNKLIDKNKCSIYNHFNKHKKEKLTIDEDKFNFLKNIGLWGNSNV